MSKIERSNTAGRFTPEELMAKSRESRAFWNSPAGKARQAQLDREKRNAPPARFPGTAGRSKLTPALVEVEIAKAKLGIL